MIEIGTVVGRLTVINTAPSARSRNGRPRKRWWCRCQCGKELAVLDQNLRVALRRETGGSRSCGCLARAINTRHGEYATESLSPEYRTWLSMNKRCYSPNNPSYMDYGARGIGVCAEWRHDYTAFLRDMGRRPGPRYSIDRIDPDKGYSPENCRWATIATQNRNRRCVNFYRYQGEVMTLAQLAEAVGLSPRVARHHVFCGRIEAAFLGKDLTAYNANMIEGVAA